MPELVKLATTDPGGRRSYGAAIWLDPATGRLSFDSWYDGDFQGPEIDIDWAELQQRVTAVLAQEGPR